jgi:hypothetical protein
MKSNIAKLVVAGLVVAAILGGDLMMAFAP